MGRPPPEVRALYVLRTLYGGVLLLAPRGVLAAVARSPLDTGAVVVARALGARQVVQSGLLIGRPGLRWQLGGAGVDAAHAASMAAFARWSANRRHQRLAAHDARAAGLLSLTGLIAAVRCHVIQS